MYDNGDCRTHPPKRSSEEPGRRRWKTGALWGEQTRKGACSRQVRLVSYKPGHPCRRKLCRIGQKKGRGGPNQGSGGENRTFRDVPQPTPLPQPSRAPRHVVHDLPLFFSHKKLGKGSAAPALIRGSQPLPQLTPIKVGTGCHRVSLGTVWPGSGSPWAPPELREAFRHPFSA